MRMSAICLQCGRRFKPYRSNGVVCSPKCRRQRDKVFAQRYGASEKGKQQKRLYDLARRGTIVECRLCGSMYRRKTNNAYCSEGCSEEARRKKQIKCAVCGDDFIKRDASVTCSSECSATNKRNKTTAWHKTEKAKAAARERERVRNLDPAYVRMRVQKNGERLQRMKSDDPEKYAGYIRRQSEKQIERLKDPQKRARAYELARKRHRERWEIDFEYRKRWWSYNAKQFKKSKIIWDALRELGFQTKDLQGQTSQKRQLVRLAAKQLGLKIGDINA